MPARLVALAPVLGLLLAGCTGASGEPPRTLPPVSPSPSASASPSVTAVEVPAEARAETPQGAAAFARFYWTVLDEAFASGDAAALRSISHPECDTCNNFISTTEKGQREATRFEGGATTVRYAEAPAFQAGDVVVDMQYDSAPSVEYDRSGRVLDEGPGERGVLVQMRVVRSAEGWVARGIRFPAGPA